MTFDLKKARAICATIDEQRDIFSPDKAAHIEVAAEMLPAALDEIERLQQNCILSPDGKIFVPDGHPELERLRRENEQQAAWIAELETAFLKAENSNLLRKQQNEDLMKNCNDLRSRAQKAEARLVKMEEWLIEERKAQLPSAPDAYWSCRRDEAIRQLANEHKIGSKDHVGEANKLILTKEQQAALDRCLKFVTWARDAGHIGGEAAPDVTCLRSLLAAPPAWVATAERREAIDDAADLLGWAISEAANAEKRDARSARVILRSMLEEVENEMDRTRI